MLSTLVRFKNAVLVAVHWRIKDLPGADHGQREPLNVGMVPQGPERGPLKLKVLCPFYDGN